ncbi:phosphotransferase [Streptomyces sp. NPDC002896]|uniref:phosphotransferase n=1 Tax=Streptomyces sp. NPDC002896 TaxID=3154438 RepID=UPI00332041F5
MSFPGGPAPHDEAVVLSPEWLTAVLAQCHPGAVVARVEVTDRLETVATKLRFRVEYADETADAPSALCAKGYLNPVTRRRTTPAEADFYRLLATNLPVRTPPCVHAAVDDETGHPLVLMHDLTAAGARFGDPLVGFRTEQAAGTLDQLAALHAATWGSTKADLANAFPPRIASLARHMGAEQLQLQLDDGRAPGVPSDLRRADRLLAAMAGLARLDGGHPRCLVHGDLHTGNVYETADGDPGLIDWQVVQHGVWALDVAYHIAAVLDPDERAHSERDLLDHYLDRLAAHGGTPPTRDEAWWAYRAHLPYGFFLWAITRAVDRPIVEHLTDRLGGAVAWHDSFALLGV